MESVLNRLRLLRPHRRNHFSIPERALRLLCHRLCNQVRMTWRNKFKTRTTSSTPRRAQLSKNRHVNFSPFIKLPPTMDSEVVASRSSSAHGGRRQRQILRAQFRMKNDEDVRNDSVSRSSLLLTGTRSFGNFGTLFSGGSYSSVVLGVTPKRFALSCSSLPDIHKKKVLVAGDMSTGSSYSTSCSSIAEGIWSTTVVSYASDVISSTPIKF